MKEIKKVQCDINELKVILERCSRVIQENVAKAEKKVEKLQEQIMGLSRKIRIYRKKNS